MNLSDTAKAIGGVKWVLAAVGEHDLQPLLSDIPTSYRDKLCLLQNELLPNDWQGIDDPTVISVWFEIKPDIEAKEITPSPVSGPQADLICDALTTQGTLACSQFWTLSPHDAGNTGGTVRQLMLW